MDQVSKRVFRNLVEPTWLALRICLAFIHSDFKTIVVPVFVYGCMAASPLNINLRVLPRLIIWIVSHLLQFCAANQAFSAEEDALNKPYRPVPAGLISSRKAYILRWFLVPFCLTLSHVWGITHAGISLAISFLAYNELGLDSYWYTKSFMNAVGIVSWNIGAAQIMRGGEGISFLSAWIAPYMSVALIWTTMHIQDFRDYAGDRLQEDKVSLQLYMVSTLLCFSDLIVDSHLS
ncbi:UbiA prenyltransferase family-domain-containing protein [Flagelloscypha sp. PMI_526]|nr:UbiA prenyltransferase family-domain-containing protein [Flagelloscypha sp. PMI_526]